MPNIFLSYFLSFSSSCYQSVLFYQLIYGCTILLNRSSSHIFLYQFNNKLLIIYLKHFERQEFLKKKMAQQKMINPISRQGPFFISHQENPNSLITPKRCEWNSKENIKFVVFLNKYDPIMGCYSTEHRWTAYKLMAKFVGTKNLTQCRNHHVKMKKQHKSVESMENYFKSIHKDFRHLAEHYEMELERLCQRLSRCDQEEDRCVGKGSVGQKQEEKTTNIGYREQNKMKKQKEISGNITFEMKKYHSMPDFYFQFFYPHLSENPHQNIFFFGEQPVQFAILD